MRYMTVRVDEDRQRAEKLRARRQRKAAKRPGFVAAAAGGGGGSARAGSRRRRVVGTRARVTFNLKVGGSEASAPSRSERGEPRGRPRV